MTLNPHPAIKAAFLQIGQATEHKQWFPGGAYRMGMAEIYLGAMADSLNSTRPAEVISELRKNEAWGAAWSQQSAWCVSEHCPPSVHPLTLFSARLLADCLFINPRTVGADGLSGWDRGRKAAIPAVHVAGWYDVFGEDQLETFNQLNDSTYAVGVPATAPQWLWVAPGGHCLSSDVSGPAIGPVAGWSPVPDEALLFSTTIFHNYVGDPTPAVRHKIATSMDTTPRLSYYLVGPGIQGSFGNQWHHTTSWPATQKQRWYLADHGKLQLGVPGHPLTKPRTILFDPADPVGTSGGNNLFILPCGPQDQNYVEATNESVTAFYDLALGECANSQCGASCFSRLERLYQQMAHSPRRDVVRFDSPPFRQATAVLGNVTVDLTVSTNCTDTDFVAKITDVFPNGTYLLTRQPSLPTPSARHTCNQSCHMYPTKLLTG